MILLLPSSSKKSNLLPKENDLQISQMKNYIDFLYIPVVLQCSKFLILEQKENSQNRQCNHLLHQNKLNAP